MRVFEAFETRVPASASLLRPCCTRVSEQIPKNCPKEHRQARLPRHTVGIIHMSILPQASMDSSTHTGLSSTPVQDYRLHCSVSSCSFHNNAPLASPQSICHIMRYSVCSTSHSNHHDRGRSGATVCHPHVFHICGCGTAARCLIASTALCGQFCLCLMKLQAPYL